MIHNEFNLIHNIPKIQENIIDNQNFNMSNYFSNFNISGLNFNNIKTEDINDCYILTQLSSRREFDIKQGRPINESNAGEIELYSNFHKVEKYYLNSKKPTIFFYFNTHFYKIFYYIYYIYNIKLLDSFNTYINVNKDKDFDLTKLIKYKKIKI